MRVCLESDRSGESGSDLGCEWDRGVGLGVGVKADGRTGIHTDPEAVGHTEPPVVMV